MSRPTRADAGGRAYLDLQNLSRREGRNTQALLVMYVMERFLARLGASEHRERLVLKGGMLLAVWHARRTTVDGDFLARNLAITERDVQHLIVQIASGRGPVEDGVQFDTATARSGSIREDDDYGGVRVRMNARVGRAVVKLSVDVSTGDPVTPAPTLMAYPTLLDTHPDPLILGYPLVTVLAEKICTAVELEEGNTRVRDYADIWTLAANDAVRPLTASNIHQALLATARHRGVSLSPLKVVIGELARQRASAYERYRRVQGTDAAHLPPDFSTVVDGVLAFADPLLDDTASPDARWNRRLRTWAGRFD